MQAIRIQIFSRIVRQLKQGGRSHRISCDQNGMATLESLPLLVIFTFLMSYGMGLFGAIHTGILQSIAARTYAFETFRNRSHLLIYRENISGLYYPLHTGNFGMRYHAVAAGLQSELLLAVKQEES